MAVHLRRLWSYKPKQYGPFSLVQSSLFENAERMGIDPSKIAVGSPIWELAGATVYNYGLTFGNLTATSGTILWTSSGIQGYDGSPGLVLETQSSYLHNLPQYSVIIHGFQALPLSSMPLASTMWGHSDGSNGGWAQQNFTDVGIRFGTHSGNIKAGNPVAGVHSYGFRQNSATSANIFLDGVNAGSGNNGWLLGDNTSFKLFSNGDPLGDGGAYVFYNVFYILDVVADNIFAYLSDNPYVLWQPRTVKYYSLPASGGTTVTATTGAVVISGIGGTVSAGTTITTTTGATTISGISANISAGKTITVGTGSITITGIQADILTGSSITSTTGGISITGVKADISSGTTIAATIGTISISGIQAGVSVGKTISVSTGAITVSGIKASISAGVTLTATTGSIAISSTQASISAGTTVTATTGALVVSGVQSDISAGKTISATTGAVVVSGIQATVTNSNTITATTGLVSIQGISATISAGTTITSSTDTIVVSGISADVENITTITATTGSIAVIGIQADISAGVIIDATTGAVIITGVVASVTYGETPDTPSDRIYSIPAEDRVHYIT